MEILVPHTTCLNLAPLVYDNNTLNIAFIVSFPDSEVPVFTPFFAPTILNDPIVLSALPIDAITDGQNRVISDSKGIETIGVMRDSRVMIDTIRV